MAWQQFLETARSHEEWSAFVGESKRNVHLAVMIEPFLSYIFEGQKTIESRFSSHAIAPYRQIKVGDLVLLKRTGGPVVGAFIASSVEFVELHDRELDRLRRDYSTAICADEEFWQARSDKRYATLIGVNNPVELPPLPIAKADRRGWVPLDVHSTSNEHEQLTLI
ncbi:hypothetical protein E0H50_05345 [Kribbella sindirgiensis]|uniref:ASCH domain-containing protein n=2 Tax=Kribbella sindirgiensis TaxID=1124744 RepID=A0A4R0IZ43_9ACTN|nr:hypothetical protein E0H50_05345 [Kribbella sindirgiensis]